MLDPTAEINRLKDLLPASWRMNTVVKNSLEQGRVIASTVSQPWQSTVKVWLNFSLWERLSLVERDLLFLREVSLRQQTSWWQVGPYQGMTLLAWIGGVWQLQQGDFSGTAIALMLGVVSGLQIWRQSQSVQVQVQADLEAIKVAEKRGYTETAASRALLQAIAHCVQLEGRTTPSFVELIRLQQLRTILGESPVPMPSQAIWE
jgi:hypothetical protein